MLLNQNVQFDENGDPYFGSYAIVFWNKMGEAEEVGFYHYQSSLKFVIDKKKIQWHGNGSVSSFYHLFLILHFQCKQMFRWENNVSF